MKLLLAIILTEALTELSHSEIFRRLREYVQSWGWFADELLGCKPCLSVWYGFLSVVLLFFAWDYTGVQIFCYGVVVHRLSNFLHLPFSYLRDVQLNLRKCRK